MNLQRDTEPRLYNSRIINTFVKFIENKYPQIDIKSLLREAEMERYQVNDENHWFTQPEVDRFYEVVRSMTGNDNAAREAGRFAASPDAIGFTRKYILGFVGPAKAYEMIGKYAPTFTRSTVYESKRIGHNKIRIKVTPRAGVAEKHYQCDNRTGYLEAVPVFFNQRPPTIKHTECMFRGDESCTYEITWQNSSLFFWKNLRNAAAVLSPAIFTGIYLKYPEVAFAEFLPAALVTVVLLAFFAEFFENRELKEGVENLRDSTDVLLKQTETNYRNAQLINEIGLAVSKQSNIEGILSEIVEVLRKRLDYDRGMILLANKSRTKLIYYAGFGYNEDQYRLLKYTSFSLTKQYSKGAFVLAFREQKPILVNDIDEIQDTLTEHSLDFAKKFGAKSFICCPIVDEDESLGILAVDNLRTKRPLLQSDINVLTALTPVIGVSINNTLLTEAYENQFKSVIKVLAASIDARDPLTAGHSEKVTAYAVGICEELGLAKSYTEVIRVAALLHDYGKIAVSDFILKKNGKLTVEEYEEIKLHVVKTREILEKVNFEGIYSEIPLIVGSHHEKMDGSGYPQGLRGEEIPLGARIIAVADFFEAITAKRHYREPMLLEDAISTLECMSIDKFDKEVVSALLRYYNRLNNGILDYVLLQR
jgi:HD-GYP domain-containing protein (c-di-GMP phosphodiesterase class II)